MGKHDALKKKFDDITDDGDGVEWSQVCEPCRSKLKLPDELVEMDAGNGICGVVGCSVESDHYVDFK